MKNIRIQASITPDGFSISADNNKQSLHYPKRIWKSLPQNLKLNLAETLAYAFTQHMATRNMVSIQYDFPIPVGQSIIFNEFLFSIAALKVEYPDVALSTAEIIRKAYNADYRVSYRGLPRQAMPAAPNRPDKSAFVMPFSFGKDSLLTYALATRILKLSPHLYYFNEPGSVGEIKAKRLLKKSFTGEFGTEITEIQNSLGNFRQSGGMMWGWDTLITQYTLLLIPYVHHLGAGNFFWSDEYTLNNSRPDSEGYVVNPCREQTAPGIFRLNSLYRMFGIGTALSSLIEPLHELAILHMLHTTFADIGKYQLSCDHSRTKRWCGNCFECARIFLFFTALGFDPKTIGLTDNMFLPGKKHLFYLFEGQTENSLNVVFQNYPERLFAFYLAYRRGVSGAVMDLFVKKLLPSVKTIKSKLHDKFLNVHKPETIPIEYQSVLLPFFRTEISRLRKHIIS